MDESRPTRCTTLPTDPKERKKYPVATGVLFYFPDAIAAVARVSYEGNEQHNPGQPLHWARGKSMDQEDTQVRHILEGGKFDTDGQRHSAKAAWRALAVLQLEIEEDQQKSVEVKPTEDRKTAIDEARENYKRNAAQGGEFVQCGKQSTKGRICNRKSRHAGRHVAVSGNTKSTYFLEDWTCV